MDEVVGTPRGQGDPADPGDRVAAVIEAVAPVTAELNCGVVFDRFAREPELMAIAVVADARPEARPVGLIHRQDIMMLWATQFGRSLFERHSIARIMDATPLVVEADLTLDALQSLIADEKPSALMRGFIVTRAGRYVGVGTALSLLRTNVRRTERRNRDLERARAAAEHANQSKTTFLANVSHELRTPLNAIIGFSELMQSETFGAIGSDRYREYVADIHASGKHLLMIINDILDMAKIETGRMSLQEGEVALAAVVESALRFFAVRARQDGLRLSAVMAPDLPPLLADQRALRQILLNLVSNALKFTPAPGTVTVGARVLDGGEIELSVADTGIGIAAEHIATVLEPFGQVANQFSRDHDGTGLGLPLARAFAALHGAAFTIDSAIGHGTTVRVRFPPERRLTARPPSPPVMPEALPRDTALDVAS